ncbi:MAG: hypothetical protein JO311_02165, partial [Candidatus Eremiobacteraeota bacterium]|nr:hypothetical protein [Candidatus Eremiobacteraeota bacterium]
MPKAAVLFAACAALGAAAPTTAPSPTPPAPAASAPSASPASSPTATPPPLTVAPAIAEVPVGSSAQITVGSAISPIAASVRDPGLVAVSIDQAALRVTLTGIAVGTTSVHLSDSRGVSRDVPVRVANYAGAIEPHLSLQLTGDPAMAQFVREQVSGALKAATHARPGADVLVTSDDVPMHGPLEQDDVASFNVPVLIQGSQYFEVDGSSQVDVANVAVPRISPNSLMVSDYPERLTENGTLFTADLRYDQPSRFLYFHYNPGGQP